MACSVEFSNGRINKLLDYVIKNHCLEINFDDHHDVYEHMLASFKSGELDDIYTNPFLLKLDDNKKMSLFSVARKYLSLCFDNNGINNWTNSDNLSQFGDDCDFFFKEVFDNFDNLLEILYYGGEDVLKLLSQFETTNCDGQSIVSYIKDCFPSEDIFKEMIISMASKYNGYKNYSVAQKKALCENANGVLYKENENGTIYLYGPGTVSLNIRQAITGEIDRDTFNEDRFVRIISDNDMFEQALRDINFRNGSFSSAKYI